MFHSLSGINATSKPTPSPPPTTHLFEVFAKSIVYIATHSSHELPFYSPQIETLDL